MLKIFHKHVGKANKKKYKELKEKYKLLKKIIDERNKEDIQSNKNK